jgi:hypothetical protein
MYAGFTSPSGDPVASPRLFPPRLDPGEITRLVGLLLGTTVIFLFGLD